MWLEIHLLNNLRVPKSNNTMFLLSLACIAVGGVIASKLREERELYAPKGYLNSLMSRPRNVYSY